MFVAVGAVLAIDALVVAFNIKPPLLGWVGFAVVAAIMLGLAALTPLAFERTRVTPQLPAEPREAGDRNRLTRLPFEHVFVVAPTVAHERAGR